MPHYEPEIHLKSLSSFQGKAQKLTIQIEIILSEEVIFLFLEIVRKLLDREQIPW